MTPAENRAALGLSIADMARALGVHRSTWNKWERAEQRPPAVAMTAMRLLQFVSEAGALHAWLDSIDHDAQTR